MAVILGFPKGQPSGAALVVPGLHVRPARTTDLPFLRHLYRVGRERELDALNWPETVRRDFCRAQFEAQHLDYTSRYPGAWFLVLEQRREPAGRLYIDLTGPSLHLIDIALLPAFQGRGIGTGILRALQDRAQEEEKPLSLHVQRGNDGAAALYRRLGFTLAATGATHDHFTWTAGQSKGRPEPPAVNDLDGIIAGLP